MANSNSEIQQCFVCFELPEQRDTVQQFINSGWRLVQMKTIHQKRPLQIQSSFQSMMANPIQTANTMFLFERGKTPSLFTRSTSPFGQQHDSTTPCPTHTVQDNEETER